MSAEGQRDGLPAPHRPVESRATPRAAPRRHDAPRREARHRPWSTQLPQKAQATATRRQKIIQPIGSRFVFAALWQRVFF